MGRIGCELENPRLAGLGVFREPDLASLGLVQAAGQYPLLAPRRRIALPEAEFHAGRRPFG